MNHNTFLTLSAFIEFFFEKIVKNRFPLLNNFSRNCFRTVPAKSRNLADNVVVIQHNQFDLLDNKCSNRIT